MPNHTKYPSFRRPALRMALAGLLLSGTLVPTRLYAGPAGPTSRVILGKPVEPPRDTLGPVFTRVEQGPQFPGGQDALNRFLRSNLRYPTAARRAQVSGTVFIDFIVGADGNLTNIQVLKGLGFGTDDEALRVVAAMPRWEPGRQSGKVVRVKYVLPVSFKLD